MAAEIRNKIIKLRAKIENCKIDLDDVLDSAKEELEGAGEEDPDAAELQEAYDIVLKSSESLGTAIELLGGET